MKQKLEQFFIICAAGVLLTACGATAAPEVLIIGDWTQVSDASVSNQGVDLKISETSVRYITGGASRSSSTLEIENVPEALSRYKIKTDGTWRIIDKKLIERVTTADIKGPPSRPQAAVVAAQMKATIETAEDPPLKFYCSHKQI